jgi:hypothetical protein
MNKGLSIALLVIGVVLLVWGISAGDSFSSNVSEAVTGSPADKTIWLIIGGILCAIVGLFGVLRGGGKAD